jgi:hypothetical protein
MSKGGIQMVEGQTAMTDIESRAMEAAEKGLVLEVLDVMRAEGINQTVMGRLEDTLIHAVENATKNGRPSDAIHAIKADELSLDIRLWITDVIAQNGKTEWLRHVFGIYDVAEEVGLKIIGFMADEGYVLELVRLARGDPGLGNGKEVPRCLKERAKEVLHDAVEKAGTEGLQAIQPQELADLAMILAKRLRETNPLKGKDRFSEGTVKRPPSRNGKATGPATLKR